VRGEGSRVWDDRGRSYLDARSGVWAVTVGYGRPDVVEEVSRQLGRLSFAPLTDAASPVAFDLAAGLVERLPGDLGTVALVPTGSEAVDTALKFARAYHSAGGDRRRRIVISREYSAHGSTYAGSSLSDPDRGLLRGIGGRLSGIRFVPAPYRYRCRYCVEAPACTLACVGVVEEAIAAAGPDRVAAVFAEPVPGPGGVLVPPAEYWPRLRALCDRHGVLLAADEVITGFGRTGRWFGLEHWNVAPDLMIFAKGVTSGYLPLSGVMLTGEVHRTLLTIHGFLPHGFTYSGHPTACAVALRNLQILEDEGLVARVAEVGARLQERLAGLRAHTLVGDVRGLGLMGAFELVRDRETKERYEPAKGVARRIALHALADGVIVRALSGDVVALSPPFVITPEQIDHVVEVLDRAIGKLEKELADD